MADRICSKGWLLSPSKTDGEYVPFFVYVRDKDIKWDESNLPSILRELAREGENDELQYPMYQWVFNTNGWFVKLHQDGSYEATKKVPIHENGTFINQKQINVDISLPFKTDNDDEFNIQITKCGTTQDIINSCVNIEMNTESIIDKVISELVNVHYYFSNNFNTNSSYDGQYLFVRVSGNVYFE